MPRCTHPRLPSTHTNPQGVAELFTEEALFQGLHSYVVGRQGMADYYASRPIGLTTQYRILETRRAGSEIVYGYLSADFAFTDGRQPLPVAIGVAAQRRGSRWSLAF